MARLPYSLSSCSRADLRAAPLFRGTHFILRLMPLSLLLSACQLVVSPSGDPNEESEAGVEARACGDRTCGAGTVCCNASCGICAAPGNVCIQIACEPDDQGATCSTVLCGPGKLCMEAPAGAVCVPAEENPCNLIDCQPESTCKVEQGEPVCVPIKGSDAGAPVKRDAGASTPLIDGGPSGPVSDAGSGEPLDAGSPQLDSGSALDAGSEKDAGTRRDSGVVVNPPLTCATVLCASGTYCDDISGQPQCIPLPSCATVKCSAGYHCELEQVVCVRAPSPPQPQCVPDGDPSDPCGGKCKANQYCQVIPINCITTPCPAPVAQCLPRSSCGGCTGKGACLDIACPVLEPN
jgi:hypothetical protein